MCSIAPSIVAPAPGCAIHHNGLDLHNIVKHLSNVNVYASDYNNNNIQFLADKQTLICVEHDDSDFFFNFFFVIDCHL